MENFKSIKNHFFLFVVLLNLMGFAAYAGDELVGLRPQGIKAVQKHPLEGFNIKFSPSIFAKTLVVELEYPVNDNVTIGLNVLGKIGRWDGTKVKQTVQNEDYLKNGFGLELVGKYYFKGLAPEGLYVQANVAYNNVFYFDGTTRPFVLNTHWRDQTGTVPAEFKAPQPFQYGLGVGYQVLLLPNHFIGNVMLGTLGNMSGNNEFQFSIYIAPSVGYVF